MTNLTEISTGEFLKKDGKTYQCVLDSDSHAELKPISFVTCKSFEISSVGQCLYGGNAYNAGEKWEDNKKKLELECTVDSTTERGIAVVSGCYETCLKELQAVWEIQ